PRVSGGGGGVRKVAEGERADAEQEAPLARQRERDVASRRADQPEHDEVVEAMPVPVRGAERDEPQRGAGLRPEGAARPLRRVPCEQGGDGGDDEGDQDEAEHVVTLPWWGGCAASACRRRCGAGGRARAGRAWRRPGPTRLPPTGP